MFINKIKEQLMAEKGCGQAVGPQNQQQQQQQPQQQQQQPVQSYAPALITSGSVSGATQTPSVDVKEGGVPQPVVTENVTVLPLPPTALMTGLVIASPSASLASSSPGLSPLAHPPTFSLAGAPAMIVSGLLPGQGPPLLAGLEKKAPEQGQGPGHQPHQAQDEGPPKAPATRKRKGRPSEPTLAELADPYAMPADDDGGKDGKSYRCRICPLSFLSKSEMQIHAKSHTESKPHHCPHCSKTFANTSYLAQHIRIHSGAKPYNCSYCQKTFRQLSHLQQHTR
ncbi:zinc finger protein 384-like, partial [Mustelus asterias]